MLCGGSRLSLPLGEGGTVRRRAVTDEGSPPMAGLTAARAFAILWLAAVAASAPSEGFGFRAPPVADTARKASRCRPQVRERIAEARAANGEGAEKCAPYCSAGASQFLGLI